VIARGSRASDGMSMVEILAVLAIVGLMASMAVPVIWKMGLFSTDRMAGSARELYALLRAAKVYAAQNRLDTALAYNYSENIPPIRPAVPKIYDQVFGVERRYLDETFMVRELSREEKESLGKSGRWFVPLQNRNGNFRPMLEQTCAFLDVRGYINPGVREDPIWFGLVEIDVCDLLGGPLYKDPSGGWVEKFYAHVFKPSGEMDSQGRTFEKLRFELNIGLKPDTSPTQRFVNPDVEPFALALGERLVPIELFATTGRVRIAR